MVPPLPLEIVQQIIAAPATLENLIHRPTLLPSLALVHRSWTPFVRILLRTTMYVEDPKDDLLQTTFTLPFSTQLTSLHVVAISPSSLGSLLSHTPNLIQLDASYKSEHFTSDDGRYLGDLSPSPPPSPESCTPFLGKDLPRLRTLILDAARMDAYRSISRVDELN
ncbi:hypothetical protein BCR35DRAFT_353508 [Leucosporidium creatinivorum]|uniref:Uncharacterized protein n=1 Tax=Leucosporidium creatinivorum TaxID=106004 RepID=A0A1Y2EWK6_9BASI|nr:hypothetical protein BCR35DRAFT_353508 [Leucosporidium creatinivorum]